MNKLLLLCVLCIASTVQSAAPADQLPQTFNPENVPPDQRVPLYPTPQNLWPTPWDRDPLIQI